MPVPLQAGAAAGGGGGGGGGGVAGVAQQLAAGLAAALQQGGNGGNVGPGLHIHHVAIPLGNLNLPPGFGGAAAAAGPGMQWQAFPAGQPGGGGAGAGPGNGNANGDDDTPSPGRSGQDVIEIPPDSQMSNYLRILRGNAPLRASELRLCCKNTSNR